MKVLKLRQKLHELGFVLLEHGNGWMVTNEGTVEHELADLVAVEVWLHAQLHAVNRLIDAEADEFDEQWAKHVAEFNAHV